VTLYDELKKLPPGLPPGNLTGYPGVWDGMVVVHQPRMTIADRAAAYLAASPIHHPLEVVSTADGGRLEGLWVLGNNYRGSGYHGAFPPGFTKRIKALFPDHPKILHLFSGSLPPEPGVVRVDINPELKPDLCLDAHVLSQFRPVLRNVSLIICDPPYSDEDCDRYGVCRVKRNVVIEECRTVLEPGGFLVWLDQVWPMYSKKNWILRGLIGVVRSTNHRARLVTILEKK